MFDMQNERFKILKTFWSSMWLTHIVVNMFCSLFHRPIANQRLLFTGLACVYIVC